MLVNLALMAMEVTEKPVRDLGPTRRWPGRIIRPKGGQILGGRGCRAA